MVFGYTFFGGLTSFELLNKDSVEHGWNQSDEPQNLQQSHIRLYVVRNDHQA
jgi:hypothetical protein